MNIQTVQQFVWSHRRVIMLYGSFFGGLAILQFVLLGSLLHGFSADEVQAYRNASNLHTIWSNPLNAPFSLMVYGLAHLLPGSLYAARLTAAVLGSGTLLVFYTLLRAWYGTRTALFAAALFGSSSWFLHTSRLGTPSTLLLFGLFALVAAVTWTRRTQRPLAWLSCILLGSALLYGPGMIWFLLVGVLWQIRTIGGLAWQRRWVSIAGVLVAVGGIAPLAFALYRSPALIKPWLGLPAHWATPFTALRSIADVPMHIFVRGPSDPQYWLGHLPLLDIFSIVMVIFGSYAFVKYSQRLAAGFGILFILSCVLIGLGGVSLGLLAPFVYALVASGVHEFIGRWLTVFPRNPIARKLGVGLMALAVLGACTYNIRAYFIAWPQSSTTESAFTYQKP